MFKKRFVPSFFRQLRGKLTLAYGLALVVTFLFGLLLAIGWGFWLFAWGSTSWPETYLEGKAQPIAPYFFVHGSPDREALTNWLRMVNSGVSGDWLLGRDQSLFLVVVDTQGQVIASVGIHRVSPSTPIQAQLSSRGRANLHDALNDRTSHRYPETDGTIVAITPIVDNERQVQGALVMKIDHPDRQRQFRSFLQAMITPSLYVMVTFILLDAIGGMIFSYLTLRDPIRRLKGLSAAADRWSNGDFSALVRNASEDELGQLARQLNRMAEQLQHLLQARQKLATSEERNRLARDLHDSVNQQLFTLAMQIGTTKVLLRRDVDAAEGYLNEVQRLVLQAQQELISLIRELRPVALESKGLVDALYELATERTQQTAIVADLHVEGTQTLPLTVEEAIFRVAQEALANVVRHSKATHVQMILTLTHESVTLSVIDNGQGFETTCHTHLGMGLLSMQERMKALGGDVQVESTSGKGTHVIAYCKLEP
jgi:signal transduction histidine kinase